ncbi:uracil-DNA glycosylase [Porphyromonadaceae bacterium W3.11]|nr:uracil-DNA glycosylase [Porphyromonadaceae bacterium W3.11]
MKVKIDPSWEEILQEEFDKPYFIDITNKVRQAYKQTIVYPPSSLIFNAFNLTPFDRVKVVILGQDPYHEAGQAMGLSFSVPNGIPNPPSLQNIYKEAHTDLSQPIPLHGDLTDWAKQGVLLINATLTVESGRANSHEHFGWYRFTDRVIQLLSEKREHIVFILWGRFAQNKAHLIDPSKHLILKAPHPSPLSAHRGFFGSKPFSQTNYYLMSNGIKPIEWIK